MANDKEGSRPPPGRRWFQFPLATLLLLILWVATLVAWQRERLLGWAKSLWPKTVVEQPDPFPCVVFHTSMGDIMVRLNAEKAPVTVENFLRYVDEGFYNDTIFHEVRRGDVIIGGGFRADLQEKPTPRGPIRNEAGNGLKNVRGAIAMVRRPDVIDSSTSQFFFDLADNSDYLDPLPLQPGEQREQFPEKYGYCVFGEVIEGMDVLEEISIREVSDSGSQFAFLPKRLVVIKSVERVRRK